MSDRDYYEILGLTPRADGTMVDQAYWHLARKYQALAITNARARQMLDELNEAYGVLGTPRLRAQYDAFRDDVLIRRGMLKPVSARSEARTRESDEPSEQREPRFRIPGFQNGHWRVYGTGGVIIALALAAAWQGVNVLFVAGALAAGLALSLTPVLRRRVSEMSISLPSMSMPSMPSLPSMPEIKAPQVSMPKLSELSVPRLLDGSGNGGNDEPVGPDELHASTAAMISRWRNTVGLRTLAAEPSEAEAPSTELVEIVESERDLDDQSEPLAAVIDILRGSRKPVETP